MFNDAVLAEYVRDGFVESEHRGFLVILNSDGSLFKSLGDIDTQIFPRSTVKCAQASAMVRHGLQLEPRLLALAASSHSGAAMHIEGAREILASVGLGENALQCALDRPLGENERRAWGDNPPTRIAMNCSGKHAAMLATCVENGWPIELATNVEGGVGEVSSIIMWYPELAAEQPDNIYSGTFYLMAEGEGMVDLVQSGGSADRINIKGIKIDGPTMVPFEYNPDGQRVTLTITSSDPDGTGEYVRNIQVVHESHMELFAAGEIFTPEFVELHQDDRAVRWMAAQDAARDIPQAAGSFEDAQAKD